MASDYFARPPRSKLLQHGIPFVGLLLIANLLDLYGRWTNPLTAESERAMLLMTVQAIACSLLVMGLAVHGWVSWRLPRHDLVETAKPGFGGADQVQPAPVNLAEI